MPEKNYRVKNGVDATALALAHEPILATSLSVDSSKIEKCVLSYEAFKEVYVSQVEHATVRTSENRMVPNSENK